MTVLAEAPALQGWEAPTRTRNAVEEPESPVEESGCQDCRHTFCVHRGSLRSKRPRCGGAIGVTFREVPPKCSLSIHEDFNAAFPHMELLSEGSGLFSGLY